MLRSHSSSDYVRQFLNALLSGTEFVKRHVQVLGTHFLVYAQIPTAMEQARVAAGLWPGQLGSKEPTEHRTDWLAAKQHLVSRVIVNLILQHRLDKPKKICAMTDSELMQQD